MLSLILRQEIRKKDLKLFSVLEKVRGLLLDQVTLTLLMTWIQMLEGRLSSSSSSSSPSSPSSLITSVSSYTGTTENETTESISEPKSVDFMFSIVIEPSSTWRE